jgi:enterochelin esterase-like enzyme
MTLSVLLRGPRIDLVRRGLLALGAGVCLPQRAPAKPPTLTTPLPNEPGSTAAPSLPFETREISVPDAPARLARALVVLPRVRKPGQTLPVLVLLHGLGETKHPRLGLRAWLEPYGLGRAWERLAEGRVQRESVAYLSDEELAAVSQPLIKAPFSGLCVVCPFLPNPYANGAAATALDRYAAWLGEGLLPALRSQVPEASAAPEHTGIAGVSLGGFAALEVYLRRPNLYRTVGSVQGAFSVAGARTYAKRLSESKADARVWVSTSTLDPYRNANQALAKELEKSGIPVSLSVRKGPHSQDWLREIGTLEMLLWHDRALRGQV